jgi:hypothetical protein
MDAKEIYEEAGALAELLPDGEQERFAAFLLGLTRSTVSPGDTTVARDLAIRRWARDAGFLPRTTRRRK